MYSIKANVNNKVVSKGYNLIINLHKFNIYYNQRMLS
jgi:hypothetical protein